MIAVWSTIPPAHPPQNVHRAPSTETPRGAICSSTIATNGRSERHRGSSEGETSDSTIEHSAGSCRDGRRRITTICRSYASTLVAAPRPAESRMMGSRDGVEEAIQSQQGGEAAGQRSRCGRGPGVDEGIRSAWVPPPVRAREDELKARARVPRREYREARRVPGPCTRARLLGADRAQAMDAAGRTARSST